MKKKNGFTLVELIAVIAILSVILVMFIPSLLNSINSNKDEALNKIYDLIETAARNYVMDYNISTPTKIELEDLCETSYIDCPIINPKTNEELNGYIFVGEDYYYSEEESIAFDVNYDSGQTSQTFNENYEPGFTIELDEVTKESYTFIGWEVVEGNSVIIDNKLTIGTTETTIKPKLVRFLNDYVKYLYDDETTRLSNGLIKDDTEDQNIRYAGSIDDVKNKVYFNCKDRDINNVIYGEENYDYDESCEIWRIIGVFDVENGIGNIEKRIKLIRFKGELGYMPWDTSEDIAVSQWGETTLKDGTPYPGATLKQYLNDGEESFYNRLTSIAKGQISEALWYTGAVKNGIASQVYEDERSNEARTSTEINYTTKWVGKIGLMYLSDWGYAGTNCTNHTISNYSNLNSCGNTSNWLAVSTERRYTISPTNITDYRAWAVSINLDDSNVYTSWAVLPSTYLKSSIQIIGGDGNDIPYKLYI